MAISQRTTTRTPDLGVALHQLKKTGHRIGMAHANLVRSRAASDLHNRIPTLGKSLTNHQILPAVNALAANVARTDIGKVVLSSTGGNPVIPNGQRLRHSVATKRISPHDRRRAMKEFNRVVTPHANSISGLL